MAKEGEPEWSHLGTINRCSVGAVVNYCVRFITLTASEGGGGGGGVYSYSMDTIEGPRAPAVKLTARHSSLTRVRAAPLSPW